MVKKPRPLPTQNPTGLLTYIPLLRSMDAVYRERSSGSRPSVPCSAENASLNFQSDPHAAQLHSRALFGKSLPAQLCSVSEFQRKQFRVQRIRNQIRDQRSNPTTANRRRKISSYLPGMLSSAFCEVSSTCRERKIQSNLVDVVASCVLFGACL